jgi:hypothetical protein
LGRSRITGANVLVELFSEPDSWAGRLPRGAGNRAPGSSKSDRGTTRRSQRAFMILGVLSETSARSKVTRQASSSAARSPAADWPGPWWLS